MTEFETPERIVRGQDIIDNFISMEASSIEYSIACREIQQGPENLDRFIKRVKVPNFLGDIDVSSAFALQVGRDLIKALNDDDNQRKILEEFKLKHKESLTQVYQVLTASTGRHVVIEALDDEACIRSGIEIFDQSGFAHKSEWGNILQTSGCIVMLPSSDYSLGLSPTPRQAGTGRYPKFRQIIPVSALVANDPSSIVPNVRIYFQD